MSYLLRLIVPCCLLAMVGCGGSGLPTIDVVGSVKVDGVAMEGVQVTFVPVDPTGQPATGLTDADGKYRLGTELVGDGALAGSYQVTVSKFNVETMDEGIGSADGDDDDAMDAIYDALEDFGEDGGTSTSLIAAKFGVITTSELTAEVTADVGENEIPVFEVSAK